MADFPSLEVRDLPGTSVTVQYDPMGDRGPGPNVVTAPQPSDQQLLQQQMQAATSHQQLDDDQLRDDNSAPSPVPAGQSAAAMPPSYAVTDAQRGDNKNANSKPTPVTRVLHSRAEALRQGQAGGAEQAEAGTAYESPSAMVPDLASAPKTFEAQQHAQDEQRRAAREQQEEDYMAQQLRVDRQALKNIPATQRHILNLLYAKWVGQALVSPLLKSRSGVTLHKIHDWVVKYRFGQKQATLRALQAKAKTLRDRDKVERAMRKLVTYRKDFELLFPLVMRKALLEGDVVQTDIFDLSKAEKQKVIDILQRKAAKNV